MIVNEKINIFIPELTLDRY